MNGQPKRWSMVESLLNVAIGYFVALSTQLIVFPLFGIHISVQDNLGIGLVFTVVSIVRSYSLRRMFNWIHTRNAWRAA